MEKRKFILVDGYNYINTIERYRVHMADDLEKARKELVDSMMDFCAYYGYKGIIVFDAYMTNSIKENVEEFGDIQVVYTKKGQTADTYLEKMTRDLLASVMNQVEVVTKDLAFQSVIFNMGALRALPEEVEARLVNLRKRNLKKERHLEKYETDSIGDILRYKGKGLK